MVNEIKDTIDELANLKSLRQLKIETARAKEAHLAFEQRSKDQQYRLEQAQTRMKQIEEEEREKCRLTAEIIKKFEQNSCTGPFFESLLEILNNFQGKKKKKKKISLIYWIFICRWNKFHATVNEMLERDRQAGCRFSQNHSG